MTVIAALADGENVVMAADTCTSYCGTYFTGARKIVRIKVGDDDALLACSGHSALLAVAQRHWTTEAPNPDDPADVQRWAHAAASALTELMATQDPPLLVDSGNDGGRQIDGAFLLGWRGRLIYFFTHAAHVVDDGVAALGIGVDLALGATMVHQHLGTRPETAVREAVMLAVDRFEGCRVGDSGPLVECLGDDRAGPAVDTRHGAPSGWIAPKSGGYSFGSDVGVTPRPPRGAGGAGGSASRG